MDFVQAPNGSPAGNQTTTGKVVGGSTYLHVTALAEQSNTIKRLVLNAIEICGAQPEKDFNVVKYSTDHTRVSFLSYPYFFEDPFPALHESWIIDVDRRSFDRRDYRNSLNPPILHRKELFLTADHPD